MLDSRDTNPFAHEALVAETTISSHSLLVYVFFLFVVGYLLGCLVGPCGLLKKKREGQEGVLVVRWGRN